MFQQAALRFKLYMKWVSPYKIKPDYCLLKPNQPQTVSLHQRTQLDEKTQLIRFSKPYEYEELNEEEKCLGTLIGQYIALSDPIDGAVEKKYVPISRIDDPGFFDILVKRVSEGFSNNLCNAKVGKNFTVRGPYTSYLYHGDGKFTLQTEVQKKYIGLICEGTALSAFFQLVEGISTNGDQIALTLIYVCDDIVYLNCQAQDDFHLLEELTWFHQEKKITLHCVLRGQNKKTSSLWPGLVGNVTSTLLSNYAPPPQDDTLIMVCGGQDFKSSSFNQVFRLGLEELKLFGLHGQHGLFGMKLYVNGLIYFVSLIVFDSRLLLTLLQTIVKRNRFHIAICK